MLVTTQATHDHTHDDGLSHDHVWARTDPRTASPYMGPRVGNAAGVRTPSSVTHDDIHYAAF